MSIVRRASIAACIFIAAPVFAQDSPVIVEARHAGVVGERYDGYLGLPGAASEQVKRLVGAANIKRRSLYTGLAARKRVSLQEVGITAGCELLATVEVGETYMLGDGVWRRRGPKEPAPVPNYCVH